MTDPVQQPGVDSFEIDGPFGSKLRSGGPIGMLALLMVCGFAGVILVLYYHHDQERQDLQRTDNTMAEMVYVLSLKQEDRDKLRLAMPDSLRSKLKHVRQPDGE